MPTVGEVCRYVRSKNAGPFWITLDLYFPDRVSFDRYADSPALAAEPLARLFAVDPAELKRFRVPELSVLKISYPRRHPQGGTLERDLHGGQQYVRLLDTEL